MKLNRSIERSIKILEMVSDSINGVTLLEIQEKLDLAKSSAFDIVKTLLELEMISCIEGAQKRYKIGIKTFQLGLNYEDDLLKIARKHIKILAEKLNKTTFLGIEKDGEIIYLDKCEPKSPIITTATLGSRNPIHCTALGKVILSGYSDEKIIKILKEKGMERKTEFTICKVEEFLKEMERVREKGYAVDNRELEENMLCLSAPIYDKSKKIIAAISASGFYSKNEDFESNAQILKSMAFEISRELGYK